MPLRRILIVSQFEPDPDYGSMVSLELIHCRACEAVAVLAGTAVGLVILECVAEVSVYMGLLKEIKRDFPSVPVVFIDGTGSAEVALMAYKNGARDYFSLPLDRDEFSRAVEDILRQRHAFQDERVSTLPVDEGCYAVDCLPAMPVHARLRRVLEFLDKNFSMPLSLDTIASEACMSKYHFCRVFKKHIGMTPVQYMNCIRIKKAMSLLAASDLPISTVAYRTGFTDLSEFNKQFKKIAGLTPSTYRKSQPSMHKKRLPSQ